MATPFLHLVILLVLLFVNGTAAETCPHAAEVDAFNFELHIGLVAPHVASVEVSCTPEELDVISNTLSSGISEMSLSEDLHIVDLEAEPVCPGHRRLQFRNFNYDYLFRGGATCLLCDNDGGDRRSLRTSVFRKTSDPPVGKHRRNAETGDLCGCQTLSFHQAITTEMDSTHEWLHSHGIDIRDSADSVELDFVSPVMLNEIGLSEVYNLDVTLVDGSTATFEPSQSTSGVTSVTLSEGSLSSIDFCYGACEQAKALFSLEIPDVEASIGESLTEALDGATVGCLEGLEATVAIELVLVEIGDVSDAC